MLLTSAGINISSETSRRHAQIDASIDGFLSVLDCNDRESEGMLSPAISANYRELISKLTIPNIRNKIAVLACTHAMRHEDCDCVPITVTRPDEEIHVPFYTLAPTRQQVKQLHDEYNVNTFELDIKRQPSAIPSILGSATIKMKSSWDAFVESKRYHFPITDNSYLAIEGRPFLFLGENHSRYPVTRSDILAHELTHVNQTMKNPMYDYTTRGNLVDRQVMKELEAYYMGKIVAEELARQRLVDDELNKRYLKNTSIYNTVIAAKPDFYRNYIVDKRVRHGLVAAGLAIIASGIDMSDEDRDRFMPIL